MSKPKRINYIMEKVCTWDEYDLSGPIENLITKLETIKSQYPDKDIKLDVNIDSGIYEDYSKLVITFYYLRPETSEELKEKLKLEKQREAEFRQREIEQLKTLKEKYPNV